jgi:hypothetical protein
MIYMERWPRSRQAAELTPTVLLVTVKLMKAIPEATQQ